METLLDCAETHTMLIPSPSEPASEPGKLFQVPVTFFKGSVEKRVQTPENEKLLDTQASHAKPPPSPTYQAGAYKPMLSMLGPYQLLLSKAMA